MTLAPLHSFPTPTAPPSFRRRACYFSPTECINAYIPTFTRVDSTCLPPITHAQVHTHWDAHTVRKKLTNCKSTNRGEGTVARHKASRTCGGHCANFPEPPQTRFHKLRGNRSKHLVLTIVIKMKRTRHIDTAQTGKIIMREDKK